MTDHRPPVTPGEEGRARAYLAAYAAGFGILWEEWKGAPDGTAIYEIADGSALIHLPAAQEPFLAVLPCKRHGWHSVPLSWPFELEAARKRAEHCGEQLVRFLGDYQLARMFQRISARMRSAKTPAAPTVRPASGATVRALRAGATIRASRHPAGNAGTDPANLPILHLHRRKESA